MTFFDSFKNFDGEAGEESTVQLVYGINVVRVEAEVATARTATVGELVELYRDQLHLPEDAVVFIDGVQAEASTPLPSTPCRVEVVKDAGVKGFDKPIIPLLPEESVTVIVIAINTLTVVSEGDAEGLESPPELLALNKELSALSFNDLKARAKMDGIKISGAGRNREAILSDLLGIVSINFIPDKIEVVVGKKNFADEICRATRRPDGVITTDDLLPEVYVEAHLVGGNWTNRPVVAGDIITAIITGESRKISLPEWEAYLEAELEKAFAGRQEDLDDLPLTELKTLAKQASVKVSGAGRTRETITSDLLAVERENWIELNGLDPEDEFDIID